MGVFQTFMTVLSDFKSDRLIVAKRGYVALLDVCIACLVLSTGNRKKMLRRAPSRANRFELRFELSSLTGFYLNFKLLKRCFRF